MISTVEPKGADILKKLDEFNAEDRQGLQFQEAGVHFLTGDISEDNINETIKWLVSENLRPKEGKMLTLYINSQGGDLYQTLALIDIMRVSQLPVRTIGYGSIMSGAFLILAEGTQGQRYVTKNCGIMCHQFSMSEEVGKYHDIKATRKETDRLNQAMLDVLKSSTGLETKIIKNKLMPAHDVYLTAEEMIEHGAADHILT
jgi:ATP-dependent Clp endopeptidase proteolytic subunit ClpP